MMAASIACLTVPSTAPDDDVEQIRKAFPAWEFRIEEDQDQEGGGSNSTSFVLVDRLETVTIVVVGFSSSSLSSPPTTMKGDGTQAEKNERDILFVAPSVVTWVVRGDMERIKQQGGDLIRLTLLSDFPVCTIHLTGGAAIVVVPPQLMQSPTGRRALRFRISQYSQPDFRRRIEDDRLLEPSLPKFHSLQVKALDQAGTYQTDFPLNSKVPVPVETDLFQGKMLLIVRPANDPAEEDPYWNERIFSKKKRRIVMQIQGRFKQTPTGTVYAGAEVTEPMKLGLVTRGICAVLLRLVETFNSNIHSSFGSAEEMAHIVAPAYTFFDRVIATPDGETPPPIDELFEEPEDSVRRRKANRSDFGQWNTTDTYSLSFYSMYIDLPTWRLVELPGLGDLHLKTFWGNSLLRICMYEKTDTNQKHLQWSNRYAFSTQLQYFGKHGPPPPEKEEEEQSEDETKSSDDDDEEDIVAWSERRRLPTVGPKDLTDPPKIFRSESQVFQDVVVQQDDDDDLHFFDAEEGSSEEEVSNVGKSRSAELLAIVDDACPAWLDVCSSRGGGYSKAFAINMRNRVTFRPAQECEDFLHSATAVHDVVKDNFSPRISSSEKKRRALGLALSLPTEQSRIPSSKRNVFRATESSLDGKFLKRLRPDWADKQENGRIRLSGFVARAVSDRHWVEEWAQVTDRSLSFHHPEKRRPHFHLTLSSMMKVEALAPELCPLLPGYHFLVLQTPGRSVYVMVSSEAEQDAWIRVLMDLKNSSPRSKSVSDGGGSLVVEIENPADEFLLKSTMWDCRHRRILNCGQFYFRAGNTDAEKNPLLLVEDALRKALSTPDEAFENFEQRRAFLNSAALLKRASICGLDEDARLAFFLNLYHVMISHAFLVLGPPDSSLSWISYFNNMAYQVDDDIFSLAELEHCIIRAKMSYPSQFLSRFVLPKSRYTMALTRADYRINFALNSGSLSNPPEIIIYRPDKLQEQLDQASRMGLQCATLARRGSTRGANLNLPRICQWFAEDFGGSEMLLKKIERFLSDQVRTVLRECCWNARKRVFDSCHIRYLPYSFECRPLSLLSSEEN